MAMEEMVLVIPDTGHNRNQVSTFNINMST